MMSPVYICRGVKIEVGRESKKMRERRICKGEEEIEERLRGRDGGRGWEGGLPHFYVFDSQFYSHISAAVMLGTMGR